MNTDMAYLLGMILGNGEIQRDRGKSRITIDIPHKNVLTDDGKDASVYVKASLLNIEEVIRPLIGSEITHNFGKRSTQISFAKDSEEYIIREIERYLGYGTRHQTMSFPDDCFLFSRDEKIFFLRGFCDVTSYIRKSNAAFGNVGQNRVYVAIPGNWDVVIGIANLLKTIDIPVQTIDFGHPNFRDSHHKKYDEGKPNYWKKEHQLKIWANEFLPIGFNIRHKEEALKRFAAENSIYLSHEVSHAFYWEKPIRAKRKPLHPSENDESLPRIIRGKHYNSWTELARDLGYHE